ncbi:MAG: hypothetical protein ACFFAO_08120 [Candidatus Hermodarchaeota archaeon]
MFIFPLIAAIILFSFSILIIRAYIKTRLITLIFLEVLPLSFAFWMINRTISALSPIYIDLFRISNVLYIIGPLSLVIFVDLISNGKISWKSIIFSFYAGALTIGAIFVDNYVVGYIPNSGYVQIEHKTPTFYIFLYSYNFIVFILVFGQYLIRTYKENKGKNKKLLRQIVIIYLFSVIGTIIFSILRIMRLIDYLYISSMDALFLAIGFGYLSWTYLKNPHIFHLDILDVQLYGLFVYDQNSGIMVYSYEFQSMLEQKELITTAFTGMDSLLKEILASDQPLKEVKHGSNIILFEGGKEINIGLVLNLSTIITRNSLYQFRVEFEKKFSEELELFFSTGEIAFKEKPNGLVEKIFYYE